MKALVIRFSSLGDCVLLCPLLARLKADGAHSVTVVTKAAYAELFACADGVDRVVALDTERGFRGLLGIARDLRGGDHWIIDAHNNWRSRFLCARLGGAERRLRKYYRERLGLIVFKRAISIPSILEQYARLAGTTEPLSPGGFSVPEAVRERVGARWDAGAARTVAMAPGSRWATKRWSNERYIRLARALVERHGCRVILVGDRDDAALTGAIARALDGHAVDVAGKASLAETAAWIERCDGFVGNDSGLMHLSEAVGVPVVGLFGPTVREFGYFPSLAESKTVERQLDCRPCSRNGASACPRGTRECLAGIDVPSVESVVVDMLNRRGRRHAVLP